MQRISFRPFIIFALIAAVIVTGGVVFYWRQVNTLLEVDVKTHIADAGKEAASDFDRLLMTEREVLAISALSLENTYPWPDASTVSETLANFARNDHFNLIGVVLTNGEVFYSSTTIRPLSQNALDDIVKNTQKTPFYTTLRPREKGLYNSAILVQAVALDPNDNVPVGALFAVQREEVYQNILALTSMGSEGHAIIINRQGDLILSYEETNFHNIFSFLEKVKLDEGISLDTLRTDIAKGQSVLVGFYSENSSAHNFFQFVPLETN